MKNLPQEVRDMFTPEQLAELEEARIRMNSDPDHQRFLHLSKIFHAGSATADERVEYEGLTAWMKDIPGDTIIPDSHHLSMGPRAEI